MERKKLSVKSVEQVVFTMLADLRAYERRHTGAILEDAVHLYWSDVFGEEEDQREVGQ